MNVANPPEAFADSNIWLYAFLAGDPPRQQAAAVLLRGVSPVVSVQVVLQHCNGFVDEIGDIEWSSDVGILPEARPDAVEHCSRAVSIIGDLPEPRFCLVEIGSGALEPA